MLKAYLFTPVFICGALSLAGCHGNNSGLIGFSQPNIVPVEDVSERSFVADKTLETSDEKSAVYNSPDPECKGKGQMIGQKLDQRLSKGYSYSLVSKDSGRSYADASTTMETVQISNWKDSSFLKATNYSYDDGGAYTSTEKCGVTAKDKGYPSIECNPSDSTITPSKRHRILFRERSTPNCYFDYGSQTSTGQLTIEVGHYNLTGGKTVLAFRTKTITDGRLSCDKKDSGPATRIQVDITTYDIPSDTGWACTAYTLYRYEKTLDGNKNHVESLSDELSDYEVGSL